MPHSTSSAHRPDTGLLSLLLVLKFHGVAQDAKYLKHQHGEGDHHFSVENIQLAAKALGFKVALVRVQWDALSGVTFPVIAQHQNGQFFVLSGFRDDKVLVHDPLEKRPLVLPKAIFEKDWNGQLILIQKKFRLSSLNHHFDIRWFIPVILRYKKLFAEVLVASLFIQVFALLTPLMFQVVIDKVLLHNGVSTLNVVAVGMIAMAFFEVLLSFVRTYISSHTANRIDVILGAKLYRHLLSLPLSYFESRRVGDSVARVRELEGIRRFLTGSSITLVIDLLFTLVFFAVLYFYSPMLTAVVAGGIPLYVMLSIVVTPMFRSRLKEKFDRGAENQAFLVESIHGIQTVKSLSVEPQMQRRWEEQLAGFVSANFKTTHLGNVSNQIAGFIHQFTVVLILWVGATLVMNGSLTVGQLIAFNMIAMRISGPVLRLVQLWQDFQQTGVSIERLGDILNTPTETSVNANKNSLPTIKGHVCFEGVTFRYSPDVSPVLDQFHLHVQAGEVIGIVGKSGSGKSTLTKLMQRLYVPESGRVLVDGYDLSMINPAWFRQQVGVVLQENFLFNRTVRDNIAIAHAGMPFEQVVQAAKYAGAHDFILNMPSGYDTILEEQGRNLSGGQRQRIAIARALVNNPKILIFDEATSALDYESERIIQQNMRHITKNRTVFIIAHRLSAVVDADRILVMDDGKLSEEGSHQQLMQLNGHYANLYRMQLDRKQG